ncbi:relaxase domain-containing protein [Nocardia terpenica]|uniref:MobF family relaxase n=1 Tax=Nocardia terpenica TaxID=455432 RepID=UPI001894903D|nr:MobF family relaxase [Nocardia terpenica]MBF6064716.1 relaxase domain-containing protein [Nocardia terpenica]MBF6107231.1 relaxase domain-containing protein [Nocardia terpenica]MBF6114988.1 relaxase domain-containing protein [Nocardia terpenica]MBF6122094.1 relaxase domain-containing protein [Nocardia terpenica]MBF6154477.1 relaxase domain-containing protein [Nocardia terpenica]
MTATLHKLSAGDGYEYYVRQVAVGDASDRGRSALADYYAAKGESPGKWCGSGLVAFADIAAGDPVAEEQMRALFGEGRHPDATRIEEQVQTAEIAKGAKAKDAARAALAATRLGAPYRIYTGGGEYRQRCAEAFAAANVARGQPRNAALGDEERSILRTTVARKMFTEEFARPPSDDRELSGWVARNSRSATTAVAGFDFTFSPPKSVSALWAIAPRATSDKIKAAHDAAVADALEYLERQHTYTRVGRNGCRQLDVEGLIGTAFVHRDSRAGDPDLHTHVVLANKVRTFDGGWYSLDGRLLYRGTVTASEVYNSRLELHLAQLVGVAFETVPHPDPSKRPTREIVGVDPVLCRRWSRRRAEIESRLGELATQFQHRHSREPTSKEMLDLAQQATLETREAKHGLRSLGEQRASWWDEAVAVLGSPSAVVAMVYAACHPPRNVPETVDTEWISRIADEVIATVSEQRATWRETHVRSEAERRVRGRVPADRWESIVETIVAAALSPRRSIAHQVPDRIATPALLVRCDGTDVYTTAGSQQYTSARILAAERRLLAAAHQRGAHTVADSAVDAAVREFAERHGDRGLNAGQEALVRGFATSDTRFAVATAPAGTGKTTAMQVLAQAWTSERGTVLGLAPTAAAAAVLGEDIKAPTRTIDKLTHTLGRILAGDDPIVPQWIHDIGPSTLVIVDEIAKTGTLKLDLAVAFLLKRGAKVVGIGDDHQLASVAAGGVVRDIVAATNAHTLTTVMRFTDRAEGPASLALRAGDPAALGFYLDHDRIHSGTPAAIQGAAYTAWHRDRAAGRDTVMLAPTHEIVHALNDRARADRLAVLVGEGGSIGRQVALADGLHASVGDVIITRRNDPRLRIGATDSVRNGYRWRVTTVHPDGSLTATHLRSHRTIVLPPSYVAADVDLGYASTISTAQGITVDTCHGVLAGHEDRAQLYVMLTRSRHANHAYVPTAPDGSEQSPWTYEALHPATVVDTLTDIIARDGHQRSATTLQREALDPGMRLGHAADAYTDAIGAVAEHLAGPDTMARIDQAADQLHTGLTDEPAWPVLRGHLATIAVEGHDPVAALRTAVAERELDTAIDAAAVLDWRLDNTGNHSAGIGPLPWLRAIPTALANHSEYGPYLTARRRLVAILAGQVEQRAQHWTTTSAPTWARPFVDTCVSLVGDLAVWRAALQIDDADRRPAGPPRRYPLAETRHQDQLHRRITAALDNHPDHAANRWATLARQIDPRLLDDPFWPLLADQLDLAHRAGIDVPDLVRRTADTRYLPDELPAAALHWRLVTALEPAALATATDRLRPAWTPALSGVLGDDLATIVLADPAWPGLVAAIEAADPTGWTPGQLLESAYALITATREDGRVPVHPHEMATALTWWINGILHHTATTATDLPPEPSDPAADEEAAARAGIPDPEQPDEPDGENPVPRVTEAEAASNQPGEDYLAALLADEPATERTPPDDFDWAAAALHAAHTSPRRYPHLPLTEQADRLREDIDHQQHTIDQIRAEIDRDDPHNQPRITDPDVLELRTRADAQRPYRLAWLDALEDHLDAEVQAATDRARRDELTTELTRQTGHDPHIADLENLLDHADPAIRAHYADALTTLRTGPDHIGLRLDLHLAELVATNSTTRATQARIEAEAARQALLEFAGGPDQLVDETDVQLAHLNATFHLHDQLAHARQHLQETKTELFHVTTLLRSEAPVPADQTVAEPGADPLRRLTDDQLNETISHLQQRLAVIGNPTPAPDPRQTNHHITVTLGSHTDAARFRQRLTAARQELQRRTELTDDQRIREHTLRKRAADKTSQQYDNVTPTAPAPPETVPEFDLE